MRWYHIIILAAACALSFFCGWRAHRPPTTNTEVKKVTEYHYDTITLEKPVYIDRYFRDSIVVAIKDTIRVHDTTYMYLPREHRVYVDSMYRAVVSGYSPRLDSIEIYQQTKVVTITTTNKDRWHVGLQGGIGASKDGLTPYIGFGITYSLMSF